MDDDTSDATNTDEPWYAVRCLIRYVPQDAGSEVGTYEERITLWRTASFEEAIERAEAEATDYADGFGAASVELAQAFNLAAGETVGDGDVVFSLMRDSALAPPEYVAAFFETGDEQEGEAE